MAVKTKTRKACRLCNEQVFVPSKDAKNNALRCLKDPECPNAQKMIEEMKRDKFQKHKVALHPQLGFENLLFEITPESIERFVAPKNRRRLSEAQIRSLFKAMKENLHFDAPLVVNEVDGVYRVLDGNHRVEAISKHLDLDHRFKITVLLVVYKDLDSDGEIQIFRRWNVGRKQSMDDFIKSVEDKVEIIKWIKQDFPVDVEVYSGPRSLSFRKLFNCYIAAKCKDDEGAVFQRENFMAHLSSMKDTDYQWLHDWFKHYKEAFGDPRPKTHYYSISVLHAAIYIAYEEGPSKDLAQRMKKVMDDEDIKELVNFSNRHGKRKILALLKEKLGIKGEL